MHLYKNFFKLLVKYKVVILSYLIIFGCLMTMIGLFNTDQRSGIFQEASFTICYVDEDDSALSRGLIDYLKRSNSVTDVKDKTQTQVEDMMFFRVYMHEFKFEKGFEDKVINGNADGIEYISDLPSGAQAYVLANQINNYINTYRTYLKMGLDNETAASKTKDSLTSHAEVIVNTKEAEKQGESSFIYNFNQNIWYIMFTVMSMSAGVVIINAMEEKLSQRIEAGPVSRRKRAFINMAGLVSFGLALYVIVLIVNLIAGRGSTTFRDYFWIIAINDLLATLSSCALVAFITSFPISNKSINMIAIILGLGFSFISGAFVPQFLLSDKLLSIAKFLPTYWFVIVNNMTHSQGYTTYSQTKVFQSFGIQILFIVVFCLGTAVVSKARTELKK